MNLRTTLVSMVGLQLALSNPAPAEVARIPPTRPGGGNARPWT